MMKAKYFLNELDDEAIAKAIADVEAKTSGMIRVFVSHHQVANAEAAAWKHFLRLKMDRTPDHNAVLIFIAPKSHKFALLGDAGIHQHGGEQFWQKIAAEMGEHFKNSTWTQGVLHAIHETGNLLAEHFPTVK